MQNIHLLTTFNNTLKTMLPLYTMLLVSCATSTQKGHDPSYFAANPEEIEASRDYIARIDQQDRDIADEERMRRARARSKANENAPDVHSTVVLPLFW